MKVFFNRVLVRGFDDFILYLKHDEMHHFWNTIHGVAIVKINPLEVKAVYKAFLSWQLRPGQFMIEIWLFGKQYRVFINEKSPRIKIEVGFTEETYR